MKTFTQIFAAILLSLAFLHCKKTETPEPYYVKDFELIKSLYVTGAINKTPYFRYAKIYLIDQHLYAPTIKLYSLPDNRLGIFFFESNSLLVDEEIKAGNWWISLRLYKLDTVPVGSYSLAKSADNYVALLNRPYMYVDTTADFSFRITSIVQDTTYGECAQGDFSFNVRMDANYDEHRVTGTFRVIRN